VTPFWQSKPPIYLGRARRESLHAQAPHRAGDGLASGHRVNLLERYDYPVVELNGRQISGPDAAGEALRDLVRSERSGQRRAMVSTERAVGRFGGLVLNIACPAGDGVPAFFLSGRCRYDAQAYQTAPGLVAALLAALDSVAEHRDSAHTQLAARRKRLEDLSLELERPFEHEARLTDLLVRQRDLLKQLDLDKDEAGSARVEAEEARMAA